jgi:preprotein translocase subunit SecE
MGEIRSERQERRAQRRQQAEDRRAARPREAQPATAEEQRHHGPLAFVHESWGELKKVEWPGQSQVIQGTVVVLVACVVVGIYLYLNDQVWKEVVQKVLLGQ